MPWNKGKKLSLETRLRMSLAKQGSMHAKTTKRKMSKTHSHMTHTPVSTTPPVPLNPACFSLRKPSDYALGKHLGIIHSTWPPHKSSLP